MSKTYLIKELFFTLQGEGSRAGCASVFLRTSACNLWNGLPDGRSKGTGACAQWCDTDFVGGDKMTAQEIAAAAIALWPHHPDGAPDGQPWIVITGGEPLLQVDVPLLSALIDAGFFIAMETNGSLDPVYSSANERVLQYVHHLTVSPKLGAPIKVKLGVTEIKVIIPGGTTPDNPQGWDEDMLNALANDYPFAQLYVQPQDPPASLTGQVGVTHLHPSKEMPRTPQQLEYVLNADTVYGWNVKRCISFVLSHPRWRLCLQTHKLIGLP
jgi:organic radical activating enzyme